MKLTTKEKRLLKHPILDPRKQDHRKWTQEEKDFVVNSRDEGKTFSFIASRLGVSYNQCRKKYLAEKRKRGEKPVRTIRQEGEFKAACAPHGLNESTVRSYMWRNNLDAEEAISILSRKKKRA